MCGICGYIAKAGERADRTVVERMNRQLYSRGPDDCGYFVSGPTALGMRRLAIIDLHTGQQPMANEDRSVWVVQNGELYNYRQLREELAQRGHRFKTQSDTEV
ncbi:MAG TPA: asparagine synthetase B, partial [Planctomycetaceae bacterium]|nr:asparagine synthetase B [Planctomycetaceae bacterium]